VAVIGGSQRGGEGTAYLATRPHAVYRLNSACKAAERSALTEKAKGECQRAAKETVLGAAKLIH
jgi:hypothetical protein